MLGDEFQDGACELEDGRVCELKYLWYIFSGADFLHRIKAWTGGSRYSLVLYAKEEPGLQMPPGVTASAIVTRCVAPDGGWMHITLGVTWDGRFAKELVQHLRMWVLPFEVNVVSAPAKEGGAVRVEWGSG